MADKILDIAVDTKQMINLQKKLSKYPDIAIQLGLQDTKDYLNQDEFKIQMYPEIPAGTPFEWSSDEQRKKVMALLSEQGGAPYERTYELMRSGVFSINQGALWIEYSNTAPYSKFVIHPQFQIIGHRKRGWQYINRFVVAQSKTIASIFQKAVKKAWQEMDKFIYGGGAGL